MRQHDKIGSIMFGASLLFLVKYLLSKDEHSQGEMIG